jgi:hypothetical protein
LLEVAHLRLTEIDPRAKLGLGEVTAASRCLCLSTEVRRDRVGLTDSGDDGGWPPDTSHIDAIVSGGSIRALSSELAAGSRFVEHSRSPELPP